MKKIILIIILILAIFQMVVMATAIDIGSAAVTGDDYWGSGNTWVSQVNSANATGKITSVEIYAQAEMANCEVATFYVVSGNNLSTRDYEKVNNGNGAGVVLAGSKQTFVVDLDVVAGDYIGIRSDVGGNFYSNGTSPNMWRALGDNIPCTDTAFVTTYSATPSIYGTGATPEAPAATDNAIMMGINF